MSISQKTQYALRALLELALAHGQGPMKIGLIAEEQAIPPRFLEVILNELKQGGFVDSRRGSAGGYFLTGPPKRLSVGEIIRHLEGSFDPVDCIDDPDSATCRQQHNCVFVPMFKKVRDAVSDIYDNTTFHELAEEKRARDQAFVLDYAI